MRRALLFCILAHCSLAYGQKAYELKGRIEPPAAVPVFLHGATRPFESSTVSGPDGRFIFRKLEAGTYTLAVSTLARGETQQTVDVTPGTVDSKGRIEVIVDMESARLESDAPRTAGATVSARVLSIPDRATKEYEEAQRCLSHGDSECATDRLRRAVGMAPAFSAAWNQLGTIAYQSKRYADAETNFRRALQADPEAFQPLVNLGGVLLNLGDTKQALAYNKSAVARRPNDALANSQLGLSYFYLGDLNMAEKYLKIAVRLDPSHFSNPQLVLAEIYLRRGDLTAARAQFSDFVERHPDSPYAAAIRRKVAEMGR